MIKEAMQEVAALKERALLMDEPTVEVDGRLYWRESKNGIAPPMRPSISVNTLGGLVKYLKVAGPFTLEAVHVTSPTEVMVLGPPVEPWLDRHGYVIARPPERSVFPFGQWLDQESFVIQSQAHFVPDVGDLDTMLQVTGTLRAGEETTFDDDGITQQVTASKGVQRVKQVELPNPVRLAPYRTFVEVAQPISTFILRVQGGDEGLVPLIGLFEVVSNDWIEAAMSNIEQEVGFLLEQAGIDLEVIR